MMRLAAGVVAVVLTAASASARDPDGKWAQRNDPLSRWYRNQTSPQGFNCCSEADAVTVDEDIRYGVDGVGHYWARWDASGGWQQVPEEAVLTTPNLSGALVVWWVIVDGLVRIRCYSPGPKF